MHASLHTCGCCRTHDCQTRTFMRFEFEETMELESFREEREGRCPRSIRGPLHQVSRNTDSSPTLCQSAVISAHEQLCQVETVSAADAGRRGALRDARDSAGARAPAAGSAHLALTPDRGRLGPRLPSQCVTHLWVLVCTAQGGSRARGASSVKQAWKCSLVFVGVRKASSTRCKAPWR